jgi:hypothetical protein
VQRKVFQLYPETSSHPPCVPHCWKGRAWGCSNLTDVWSNFDISERAPGFLTGRRIWSRMPVHVRAHGARGGLAVLMLLSLLSVRTGGLGAPILAFSPSPQAGVFCCSKLRSVPTTSSGISPKCVRCPQTPPQSLPLLCAVVARGCSMNDSACCRAPSRKACGLRARLGPICSAAAQERSSSALEESPLIVFPGGGTARLQVLGGEMLPRVCQRGSEASRSPAQGSTSGGRRGQSRR